MHDISKEYVEECIAEAKMILDELHIESDPREIESLCGRLCGRLAIIVMMVNTLAELPAAPPSIWLGEIAGVLLGSEVQAYVRMIDEEARNN